MPMLETVSVGANTNGDSAVEGAWSISENGRIGSAELAQYYEDLERLRANATFKELVWEAYEKPAITLALGWYFSGVVADIMYLNEGATITISATTDTGEAAAPLITRPYVRPRGISTPAQRASVQGKPCVDCGVLTPRQVADHKLPMSREYWETGTIDLEYAKSVESVQPQCPTCSARQGADLMRYSIQKRAEYTD